MCISVMFVMDYMRAAWRVKATLRYRFKTLDRKPHPLKPIRSQSYTGPTTVGPDLPVHMRGGGAEMSIHRSDVVINISE